LICSHFSQISLSMVVKASKESQNDKVSCHRSKIDEIGVSFQCSAAKALRVDQNFCFGLYIRSPLNF